jgi:hypothetical protein
MATNHENIDRLSYIQFPFGKTSAADDGLGYLSP